jgi:hypothetical protein
LSGFPISGMTILSIAVACPLVSSIGIVIALTGIVHPGLLFSG